MSAADLVTDNEVAKLAGILEGKWTQTYQDRDRLKAEAGSLRTALGVMSNDRDYWRERAEAAELERDLARESEEYMHRQWQSVGAIAKETVTYRSERLASKSLVRIER
jgi:hypothetical protein